MKLILDIGNTNVKQAIFEEDKMLSLELLDSKGFNLNALLDTSRFDKTIISSVKRIDLQSSEKLLLFDYKTPLPIKNDYKSATIGSDRLAAAVGAFYTFPNSNVLIVDVGSAITIDFLDAKGHFKGGNISPGVKLRFKALHNFTDNLPFVDADGKRELCSDTTEDAIRSGVMKGVAFELEGYIDAYKQAFSDLKIIFTGGDSKYFVKTLKNRIFADENLVLKGLNRILSYDDKKK